MSASSRRRHSKWDHKGPETESFHDTAPPRKPRETLSPGRRSHRHESRSKERMMTWDREGNCRTSPDLDEWTQPHRSRSPRNGWGRSYSSRSRSRSRSPAHNSRREPALTEKSRSKSGVSASICRDYAAGRCRRGSHCQFLHQDAQLYERGRSFGSSPPDEWEGKHRRPGGSRYSPDDSKDYVIRSEKSSHVCNDFVRGQCRRGASCRYVHHDGATDVFERGPVDDVYRDRHNDRRIRDTYSDRNYDCEPPKRGETLCKFFAAGNCRNGKRCRFSHQVPEDFSPEKRSHDERRGPEHKFEGSPVWDGPRWDDAPRASNIPAVQGWQEERNEIADVGNEVITVRSGDDSWSLGMLNTKQTWDAPASIDKPKSRDQEQPLHWKSENSVPGMGLSATRSTENFSGDMEISPRDILKQHDLSSSNPQTSSLSNISFAAAQQDTGGEASYEKHYPTGFQEQRVFDDPYAGRNPNFKDDKPNMYAGEGGNAMVNFDSPCVTPSLPMNVQPGPSIFQNDQHINAQPIASTNPPAGQGQLPFPLNPSGGDRMQTPTPNPPVNVPPMQTPTPNPLVNVPPMQTPTLSPLVNVPPMQTPTLNPLVNVPPMQTPTPNPLVNVPLMQSSTPNPPVNVPPVQSSLPSDPRINIQPISSIKPPSGQGLLPLPLRSSGGNGMQKSDNPAPFLCGNIADGPHLANVNASLLGSATATNHSTVSDEQLVQHISASLAQLLESTQQLSQLSSAVTPNGMSTASDPPVSGTAVQPNQAVETLKKYDPICDSFDMKMPSSGNHQLPSLAEQKSSENEVCREGGNVNQQEPLAAAKGGEDGPKLAEGRSKALENGPTEDMAVEDGADDGKKSKDTKVTRPFKFALAEFVKELLKPAWKDGQVNKEAYKTIVKKVVDKVIETQGPQVPQTKEKIDQYLSCSKPKLDKLVQAYVGKYQKS